MAVRMLRKNRILHLAQLIGNDDARVLDTRDGWPGLMEIKSSSGEWRPFEVHVGAIGTSTGRGRRQVESRFQNPANKKPMSSPSGAPALLLGMWEPPADQAVLVCMETEHRIGKATRQSLFFPRHLLERAAAVGWAEHFSSTGEQIVGLLPSLLPTYVEMRAAGVMVGQDRIISILEAAGLRPEADLETPVERARRASSQLVRSSTFSKRVIEAYGGLCAMCGLDLGLIEGAHIYPAQAPGSPDEIWNGLALCSNHHRAFDKHWIRVDPTSFDLRLHPELLEGSQTNRTSAAFVEMTREQLRLPRESAAAPRGEMFQRRYDFFPRSYGWA